MSADPRVAFPPPERKAPPQGRAVTAAESMPFFFSSVERDEAARVRAFADRELYGPAAEDADNSIETLARGGLLGTAIGPREEPRRGSLLRCVTREEIAYASPMLDAVLAVQGLGAHPIVLSGTKDAAALELVEKGRRGDAVFGFAVTEPEAGSDVGRIACAAKRDGDRYVLTGTKAFISNAGIATHYTLFARTAEGKRGISCLLVPASAARVEALELNAPHPCGVLRFEGTSVPATALLGEEGQGTSLALGTLDLFRSSVGAAAIGMGRRALDEARAHLEARVQFGAPLAENAQLQALVATAATELEAARLLVYRAAWLQDHRDGKSTLESAMGKLAATEAAQKAVDLGVQLHGGLGVVAGRTVEMLYRAVRALRIYEGASEVMRLVIGRELRGPRTPRA